MAVNLSDESRIATGRIALEVGRHRKLHQTTTNEESTMSYTNEIIRDITDVANPKTKRTLAIADSEKSAVALTTLATTAGELGLSTKIVDGVGESGEANRFLIVAQDDEQALLWEIDLAYADLFPCPAGSPERMRMQSRMGAALGYDQASITEFVNSEVAATCPCTCCGGNPE
jgi:hypothetical protein